MKEQILLTGEKNLEAANNIRSFLQRSEVRLSTMHRIAGIFLNGAALLLLLPFFFRTDIVALMTKMIGGDSGQQYWFLDTILIAIGLFLPLLSLFFLIRDIVLFYFQGSMPGFDDQNFLPRFSMTSLAVPKEVGSEVKNAIKIEQYSKALIQFIVPQRQLKTHYFDALLKVQQGSIIPPGRDMDASMPEYAKLQSSTGKNDINRLLVAFGLTGFVDRTLIEEAAKMEVSLVRHSLGLRRLVFRYVKALLISITTVIYTAFIAAFNGYIWNSLHFIVYIAFAIWGASVIIIVRWPINWVHKHSGSPHLEPQIRDPSLVSFERWARGLAFLMAVAGTCGAIWSLLYAKQGI